MNRVKDYFNADPSGYFAKYTAPTAEGYAFRVRRESLLSLLGRGAGRVLDIGCGPGVMTKEIRALGWHYTGMDIAPEMIRIAAQTHHNDRETSFVVGPVETIKLPDESFDVVVAMGLVEYLTDERRALAEIRRVLKPGGRLIVSIPNWWSPARMWDRWILTPLARLKRRLMRQAPSTKLFHREYKLRAYKNWLRTQGFRPARWQAYNYRVTLRPFDYWLPRFAITTAKLFENTKNRLWWLGTSLNVEAVKS